MCLLIPATAVTLFATMPIWSASSTGATAQEWPVRISGMQAVLVIGTVQRRHKVFRATSPRVRQDTGPESRQDMQLLDMQPRDMQPRARCISPASLPDSLDMAHALALRARRAGQTPPRQQQQPHLRLLLQLPHNVTLVGKRDSDFLTNDLLTLGAEQWQR
jgi:hypothetical protein